MTDNTSKQPPKTSSQMEAVMRLMTGKEERTIAEKFADSNRPTWEQYKKDNQDKLDIQGTEQKEMQKYRKELDEQREKILARGVNHGATKKKKRKKHRDDSSESDDSKRRSKKRKRKHRKKKHKKHHYSSSSESDCSSDSDSEDSRKRKRHKKKKKKSKRKHDKKEADGEDERYRLSNFFTQASDEE